MFPLPLVTVARFIDLPCPRNGAFLGEESVLADSGWEGEVAAGVGRVRSLAFLNGLRWMLNKFVSIWTSRFCPAQVVCRHPSLKDFGETETGFTPDRARGLRRSSAGCRRRVNPTVVVSAGVAPMRFDFRPTVLVLNCAPLSGIDQETILLAAAVHLVSLVCSVYLVYACSLVQPNRRDRPDRPNQPDRLADYLGPQ